MDRNGTDRRTIDPLADEVDVPIVVEGLRGRFERDELIDALADASAGRDADLQAFDPPAVHGREHLEAAARRAVRSHREQRAIARDLAVEIACYAAGTDQIDDALATVGVPAEGEVLVACGVGAEARGALEQAAGRLALEPGPSVLSREEASLDRIGVPARTREAVPEEDWPLLAVEHVALLDARR